MTAAVKPTTRQMISLSGPKRLQSLSAIPDAWRPVIAELNEYVAAGAGKNKQAVLCLGLDRTSTGVILCRRDAQRDNDFCTLHAKRRKQ